jgi:hypothetical protein
LLASSSTFQLLVDTDTVVAASFHAFSLAFHLEISFATPYWGKSRWPLQPFWRDRPTGSRVFDGISQRQPGKQHHYPSDQRQSQAWFNILDLFRKDIGPRPPTIRSVATEGRGLVR